MSNAATDTATYSIDFFLDYAAGDAGEQVMHIYRYTRGGVCCPFSQQIPCATKEQAEQIAFSMGYLADGTWDDGCNGSTIPAVKIL